MRLSFCFLLGALCLNGFSQDRLSVTASIILRKQQLTINDTGGYFIGDQYTQRLTYGITAAIPLTSRWRVEGGLNRIFFVADANTWFGTSEPVLFFRDNPLTGFQIFLGASYNLIRVSERSRWRILPGMNLGFNRLGPSSGRGGIRSRSILTDVEISGQYSWAPLVRTFVTLNPQMEVRYRLSRHFYFCYVFQYQYSLEDQVQVMNVNYTVSTAGNDFNYQAQTVANGSARHHCFGLTYSF
jgi:hypothetical protein